MKVCTAHVGATWTTDAPFRETDEAIAAARTGGILAVEMEAAASCTPSPAANQCRPPLPRPCHQHHGTDGPGFRKGEADGTADALRVLEAIVAAIDP